MRTFFLTCFLLVAVTAAERVQVDFTKPAGRLKPLNGVNKGPLAPGGLIDLTPDFAKLNIPFVRLHDCHWPNPDVVDIHVVFPRPEADPQKPSSYDFTRTDEYIQAIRATGAQVIYRLGESIEHTKDKRFVHPPADPEKWAQICLGIIKHYPDIEYWEIWNEPENRPVMWTGNDEQYINLYRVTARAIKTAFPKLKVGGPALGASGSLRDGKFIPTEFLKRFLEVCRSENLPLDFFSWHCYTDSATELVGRTAAIRALLDDNGFTGTESHLNEWNYLPDNSWKSVMRDASPGDRTRYYQRMGGAEGASFACAAMILLQDAPLDLAAFFHGELGGFGLFTDFGVPNDAFEAFRCYGEVAKLERVSARGDVPVLAGVGPNAGAILLANAENRSKSFTIETKLPSGKWASDLDSDRAGRPLRMEVTAHSWRLIRFRREQP